MTEENKKINRDILKWIVVALAGFAVVVLIFGAGMLIGGAKARFSYRWAENYHKNFGGPRDGFLSDWQKMPLPRPGDFIEGHGVFGEIIKINDSDILVKGQGDVEKIIVIAEDTAIKIGRKTVKKDELKIGDKIVIIGSPDEQGQIEAKFIRIFDGEDVKALPRPQRFP